jgi:hypothetical protein
MSPRFGRNSQPSNNGTTGFQPSTPPEIEEALHFARKHEQRVWGSGDEHEKAHAEVERLEKLLPGVRDDGQPKPVLTAASASGLDRPFAAEAMPVVDLAAFGPNLRGAAASNASGALGVKNYGVDVARLISLVQEEETSGGNCGAFAIALARVLGPAECEYAMSSAEWRGSN